MKNLLLIFSTIFILLSCEKTNYEPVVDPITEPDTSNIDPTPIDDFCIEEEAITSIKTGFALAEPGLQIEGKANGIKINEEWSATAIFFPNMNNDKFWINLITYWTRENDSHLYLGEFISIGPIDRNIRPHCYNLTSGPGSENTIRTYYSIKDGDVTVMDYEMDSSKENLLEIIEYNFEEKKFKGKFKSSYVTDEAADPEFPEKVRFFNVDIEVGYD